MYIMGYLEPCDCLATWELEGKAEGHRAGLGHCEVAGGVGDREHGEGTIEVVGW